VVQIMRFFVLTLAVFLALAHAEAEPQSFLDNFTNFFRRPSRPAPRPPQRRPPPQQQQFQPQQGVPIQPAQPVQPQQFRQPPPQQQQFRQPPPQQQPIRRPPPQQQQQQFRQPQQVETFRRPAVTQSRPPQQVINTVPVCDASNRPGVAGCPASCPNDKDEQGKDVIVTWNVDGSVCSNFTQDQAEEYCKQQGGRTVSLDSNARAQHFISLAIRDRKRYFWTGGKIDHSAGTVTWPSKKQEGYIRGERFWSTTGGKKPVAEPQPDNRDGNEFCIAVLNNFYADGVKWHDVGCHHKKPTICEFP